MEKVQLGSDSAISIPNISIGEAVSQGLKFDPDRTAYHFMGAQMTFGDLDREAQHFSGWLHSSGHIAGDVVAIYSPNIPQFLIALAGAFKAGCVVNGVSPLLTPKELAYQLNDCKAKTLVALDMLFGNVLQIQDEVPHLSHVMAVSIGDYLPAPATGEVAPVPGKIVDSLRDIIQGSEPYETSHRPDPQDTALLMYTGGTTGPSKGCEITHRTLVAETMTPNLAFNLAKGTETFCSAFPFFHIAGMGLAISGMANAYTQVLIPDPRNIDTIIDSLATCQPTFVANVPTLYLMLMDDPRFKELDMASSGQLKACISGAAPFASEPFQTLEGIVGQGKVIEAYGATETCSTLTANPLDGEKKLGSVGLPMPGNRVKIVDLETGTTELPVGQEGEVIANGPKIMKGYLNKPEETAHALRQFQGDTWLYTGDVGKLDKDGYLYIVDRTKDMILVGGFNVFSKVVEDRLYEHPAIEMCAVIGVPNPDRQGDQMVKAVIQLSTEFKGRDRQELRNALDAFCREELAPYKVPKVYEFTDGIPLTAVGKVDKKALR